MALYGRGLKGVEPLPERQRGVGPQHQVTRQFETEGIEDPEARSRYFFKKWLERHAQNGTSLDPFSGASDYPGIEENQPVPKMSEPPGMPEPHEPAQMAVPPPGGKGKMPAELMPVPEEYKEADRNATMDRLMEEWKNSKTGRPDAVRAEEAAPISDRDLLKGAIEKSPEGAWRRWFNRGTPEMDNPGPQAPENYRATIQRNADQVFHQDSPETMAMDLRNELCPAEEVESLREVQPPVNYENHLREMLRRYKK